MFVAGWLEKSNEKKELKKLSDEKRKMRHMNSRSVLKQNKYNE